MMCKKLLKPPPKQDKTSFKIYKEKNDKGKDKTAKESFFTKVVGTKGFSKPPIWIGRQSKTDKTSVHTSKKALVFTHSHKGVTNGEALGIIQGATMSAGHCLATYVKDTDTDEKQTTRTHKILVVLVGTAPKEKWNDSVALMKKGREIRKNADFLAGGHDRMKYDRNFFDTLMAKFYC